jgi:hypothetical protein
MPCSNEQPQEAPMKLCVARAKYAEWDTDLTELMGGGGVMRDGT